MTNRLRAIALASLVLSGTLLLTACGSSKKTSKSSGSASALLSDTFSGGHSIKSGKLALSISATLQGGGVPGGPLGIKLTGPFDHLDAKLPPKFDVGVAASFGGQSFNGGAVSDGNSIVLKVSDQAYAVPDTFASQLKQSYAQGSPSSGGAGLSALGIKPLSLIKNATIAGDKDIGGEATTHITADLDANGILDAVDSALQKAGSLGLPAQAGALPKSLPSDVRQQIIAAIKNASVDVYTGKSDHTLREFDISLAIAPPSGSAGSLKEADVKLMLQLTDVNKPQTVELPPNPKPFSQLQQQLSSLLGGLAGLGGGAGLGTGGTGTGTGTAPTSPIAPAGKAQKALQSCIASAGGDQTKLSKCLSLVPSG